ncbi:hypothetical protein B0T26DRAFT_745474 [Lasiosphaeria miniovina]|uniref:Uncharacterized protein n=1 Tax=Lasiosphaeria miniovina TaxID=1954250 RepID=A0AA40BGC5_9PEZI|nr:uncharacterized protein B0T26DRAFT_745474 [Lasiosphaeria miniovina]KAK0733433.1 hypothetical protein B0T26DRAFT_745474 [Lasiosphaeria miniovina]
MASMFAQGGSYQAAGNTSIPPAAMFTTNPQDSSNNNNSNPNQPNKKDAPLPPSLQQQQRQPPQQQPQQQLPPLSMPPSTAFPFGDHDLAKDPRYVAMASRIASYYQQRCRAITNYQQQQCQAWASMHRKKCQEMMQAAMLIVAWYIRDRISRRRRRQKRAFKRGLARKAAVLPISASRNGAGGGRITKGEAVRRWVMEVPVPTAAADKDRDSDSNGAAAAAPVHDALVDEEEAAFFLGREPPAPTGAAAARAAERDKDAHLFSVADHLIKSQLARIDVPLLGALSFDESDTESESSYDDDEDYEEDAGNREDGDVDAMVEDGQEGGTKSSMMKTTKTLKRTTTRR